MATCFEFNSCHLNTSSHCTWMNLRQRQHSCQEMSPSGLELSYFLGTCFLRSRNPLSCEVKWWVKLLGMDEEYGPTDCGGTLEQESFSHNKSPLGQRTSHFQPLSGGLWPMLSKSATHLPWLNGRTWKNWGTGAFPSVCLLQFIWVKTLKTSLPTGVQYRGKILVFVVCC